MLVDQAQAIELALGQAGHGAGIRGGAPIRANIL